MKLRDWIDSHRMTHEAFAAVIGVEGPTVTRYVNGDRVPRPEIMARIKAATEGYVTADDFMVPAEDAGSVNARSGREMPTGT